MHLETMEGQDGLARVWPILTRSLGRTDASARARVRRTYRQATLLHAHDGGPPLGVIGVRLDGAQGEILHIAVSPAWERRGLGRWMVESVRAAHPEVAVWSAQTDDDAVGFYRALGFAVLDLGEGDPGVRRCSCRRGP